MRLLFACLGLLVVGNATAMQYCGNLQRNSSAYYACESMNQQERFEQERKREQDKQEEQRRSDRLLRHYQEREQQQSNENRVFHQQRSDGPEEKKWNEDQEFFFSTGVDALMDVDRAIKEGRCEVAQREMPFVWRRVDQLEKTVFFRGGQKVTRDDLINGAIAYQCMIYEVCLKNPKSKILEFLERESKKGRKSADDLLVEYKAKFKSK